MSNLFKKLAFFTDIHYGRNLNAVSALNDNTAFVNWFLEVAQSRGCDTFIHGGDWHDNRHSLNLHTFDSSLKDLEKINRAFKQSFFITGNHDQYYRDSRDITSMEFSKYLPNIRLMNNITTIDNVSFLPWLNEGETKGLNVPGKYVFAHLEVPGFLMNAQTVKQQDEHAVQPEEFKRNDIVFTGHFHKRQQRGNILYTGNVMPFDFRDDGEEERGMMILNWNGEPEFITWPDQPLYRQAPLSALIRDPDRYLKRGVSIKVHQDVPMSYEDTQHIKETFTRNYGLRKIEMIGVSDSNENEYEGEISHQTVDRIVLDGISTIQSSNTGIQADYLTKIYNNL